MPLFFREDNNPGREREREREAEREAAYRRAVANFYDSLKKPEVQQQVTKPLAGKPKLFVDQHAPSFSEQELIESKAYIMRHVFADNGPVKTAIAQKDINQLRLTLGPELYLVRQTFLKNTHENRWIWLKSQCQFEVRLSLMKTLITFLKSCQFPQQLTKKQKKELKKELTNNLGEIKKEDNIKALMSRWQLDKGLSALVQAYFLEYVSRTESDISTAHFNLVPEMLYDLNSNQKRHQKWCEKREKEQTTLNQQYSQLYTSATLDQQWQTFQQERESAASVPPGAFTEQIQQLRKSRLAEVGLSCSLFWEEGEERPEPLFNQVARQYAAATDTPDKKQWLFIIEVLLQHGDKPSAEVDEPLDWSLLELVLKYLDPSTQYSEQVRQHLLSYTIHTQEELSHWWTRFFINLSIKEQRREDVQAFTQILASGEGLVADQKLVSAIEARKTQARRGPGRDSVLYLTLKNLTRDKKEGKLIALPTEKIDTEMHSQPSTGILNTASLFQGLSPQPFPFPTGVANTEEKNEEKTDQAEERKESQEFH